MRVHRLFLLRAVVLNTDRCLDNVYVARTMLQHSAVTVDVTLCVFMLGMVRWAVLWS